MDNQISTTIVIFGASGDLTERKLIPALFSLYCKKRLPEKFRIIGFAGTKHSDDSFRSRLYSGLNPGPGVLDDPKAWQEFSAHVYYITGRATEQSGAEKLADALVAREGGPAHRLYYMATPPDVFPAIIDSLGKAGMLEENEGWRRVVIEKPFGTDLSSAQKLNHQVHQTLRENQIYRIDHYLGKETVQNILVARFANAIFEPLWNRNYIDHVQISVSETVGLENRGGYYDGVGVLRDMFQNHLFQLLTLVAMEPTSWFEADALRDEKVKVLRSIRPFRSDDILHNTVRAQYQGYRDEPGVLEGSSTPTYAAMKLLIDNWRWEGVPFYLRSGKKLAEKFSEVIIQFKRPPHLMFPLAPGEEISPNLLAIYIHPQEGIHLRFGAKEPDTVVKIRDVDMEFQYHDSFGPTAIPEAYERLLLDALQGDAALFTRADEVELAWELIDPVIQAWETAGQNGLVTYEPGTCGPIEADQLLEREHRHWLRTCR